MDQAASKKKASKKFRIGILITVVVLLIGGLGVVWYGWRMAKSFEQQTHMSISGLKNDTDAIKKQDPIAILAIGQNEMYLVAMNPDTQQNLVVQLADDFQRATPNATVKNVTTKLHVPIDEVIKYQKAALPEILERYDIQPSTTAKNISALRTYMKAHPSEESTIFGSALQVGTRTIKTTLTTAEFLGLVNHYLDGDVVSMNGALSETDLNKKVTTGRYSGQTQRETVESVMISNLQ
ncbi:MAG: hypothetical protein LBT80_03205 [Lactobacillaceae bacterium]|jgi:hypothetical protein|nr:hypothetical protein [Lactobacillaceae bacterium]